MVALTSTFDATTVEPNNGFGVIPAGKYLVQAIESDLIPTKNGNGQMLVLTFEIIDGEHTGRKLWDRLNIINSNSQTVEIAQRTLSSICHACGKLSISDSEELHFIPLIANVRVRPAGDDKNGVWRDESNEIRGYSAANGAAPKQQARPAAAQSASPVAAQPKPQMKPWEAAKLRRQSA